MVASGHATNPFLYPKIPYDTFKDFTPISLLASSPNILLVHAKSPYKTLADLLAQARAKPGSLSYGMAGNGTSTHLAGELLKNLAKVDIVAIPYKGGGPAMNDLLGGQIPMSFNNGPESVGQISAVAFARSASPPRSARRSCRMFPPWPRPAWRATTPGCGGAGRAGRDVGAHRRAIVERFRRRVEGARGEGSAQYAGRDADRQLAEGFRYGNPRRL